VILRPDNERGEKKSSIAPSAPSPEALSVVGCRFESKGWRPFIWHAKYLDEPTSVLAIGGQSIVGFQEEGDDTMIRSSTAVPSNGVADGTPPRVRVALQTVTPDRAQEIGVDSQRRSP
jgi:hypothetical protein